MDDTSFNFSSKYLFIATKDAKQKKIDITVSINSNYIDNFFGNNISNITAIVGANGSGKTTILEMLIRILADDLYIHDGFIACFYNQQENQIITIHDLVSFKKRKIKTEWDVIINSNDQSISLAVPVIVDIGFDFYNHPNQYSISLLRNTKLIYYSPAFDLRNYPYGIKNSKNYIDVSTNNLLYEDSLNKNDIEDWDQLERHRFKNARRQFEFIQDKRFDLSEIHLPDTIEVHYNKSTPFEKQLSISDRSLFDKIRNQGNKYFSLVHSLIHKAEKAGQERKINAAKLEKIKLWFIINLVDNYFSNRAILGDLNGELNVDYEKIKDLNFFTTAKNLLIQQDWITKQDFDFVELIESVFAIIDKKASRRNIDENNASFEVGISDALEMYKWDVKLRMAYKENLGKSATKAYSFFDLNWRDMSTGEKAYLDLFSRLFFAYRRITESLTDYLYSGNNEDFFYDEGVLTVNHIYILLDEPELGFHPKWQKKFIRVLTEYLSKLTNLKIQVILTSHSPFVLSDLPKSNVIFVSREGDSPLKVTNASDQQETFGANIHDLFADTFFLGERLVGDFSFNFIMSLVSELEKATTEGITIKESLELKKKINLVGENVIRFRLEEMYQKIVIQDDIERQILEAERNLQNLRSMQGRSSDS